MKTTYRAYNYGKQSQFVATPTPEENVLTRGGGGGEYGYT